MKNEPIQPMTNVQISRIVRDFSDSLPQEKDGPFDFPPHRTEVEPAKLPYHRSLTAEMFKCVKCGSKHFNKLVPLCEYCHDEKS